MTTTIAKEEHLEVLEKLREQALATGNLGSALQAETQRAKLEGLYEDTEDSLVRELHLAVLEQIRDRARREGNWIVSIQAEIQRGKAAGLYAE